MQPQQPLPTTPLGQEHVSVNPSFRVGSCLLALLLCSSCMMGLLLAPYLLGVASHPYASPSVLQLVCCTGSLIALAALHHVIQQEHRRHIAERNALDAVITKLQQAKEAADDANEAKSRYLSGVSHELRTPLNTVYGYAQLIERNSTLPQNVRDAAYNISKSGEHLTDIIEGLLEISKIEARRVDFLNKEDVDLHLLLRLLVESFTMQAQHKGIVFAYEQDTRLPQYVSTDAKRLRQVLMNLLSNAIRFTAQGSVSLRVSYRNEVAKFIITDTGIGISPEHIEQIFEPFERVHDNTQTPVHGTGLGLSISRLLVDLLGGDIAVKSQLGQGSTFTFAVMLPSLRYDSHLHPKKMAVNVHPKTAQTSEKTTHSPTQCTSIIGYTGARRTILILDDEAHHRALLAELLEPLGFAILQADNGTTATTLAQQTAIDACILDVSMPPNHSSYMSGWDVAQALRNNGCVAPILMLSGNAIEMQPDKIQGTLHSAYLVKPVHFDDLLSKLGKCMQLQWQYGTQGANVIPNTDKETGENTTSSSPSYLENMLQAAHIGHLNGVRQTLEKLQAENPEQHMLVEKIKNHLSHFNLVEVAKTIEEYYRKNQ